MVTLSKRCRSFIGSINYLFFLAFAFNGSYTNAESGRLPYTLGIRDSLMIAHSFHNNPAFGPAGGMHGATYTCDVEFKCKELAPTLNWVLDIGYASDLVASVLSKYNLKNLDEVFPGKELTTTEFMARQIHDDLIEKLQKSVEENCDSKSGEGKKWKGSVQVKLWESHNAWASYEGGEII